MTMNYGIIDFEGFERFFEEIKILVSTLSRIRDHFAAVHVCHYYSVFPVSDVHYIFILFLVQINLINHIFLYYRINLQFQNFDIFPG